MVRAIKIAALNISMHKPHSPRRYVDLFKQAYELKHMVRLGKLHSAMMGSLYVGPDVGRDGVPTELSGDIYRFVNLDASQPWFNTETGDVATDNDVRQISIPPNLLPHLQRLAYLFRPHTHELVYVAQDRGDRLGAETARVFFERLFKFVLTKRGFPPVEVTAFPDKEALDTMLSLPRLEKLTIILKRPNPDDLGGEIEKWMKKLEKQKARSAFTELVAVKGESLQPDSETRKFAEVAAVNGQVSVIGRDAQGLKFEDSTVARPWVKTEHINDNLETVIQVLQRIEPE